LKGLAAARAWFALSTADRADWFTGFSSGLHQAESVATATHLLRPLLAGARSADRFSGLDAVALADAPARTTRRGGCAVAALAQHHLTVAVGDETESPAFSALVMVDGITFETVGADPFSGAVKVGEVSFLTATCTFSSAAAAVPAAPAATQALKIALQRTFAKAERALRDSNVVSAGGYEQLGQTHGSR
jgi:hypothetical protein